MNLCSSGVVVVGVGTNHREGSHAGEAVKAREGSWDSRAQGLSKNQQVPSGFAS